MGITTGPDAGCCASGCCTGKTPIATDGARCFSFACAFGYETGAAPSLSLRSSEPSGSTCPVAHRHLELSASTSFALLALFFQHRRAQKRQQQAITAPITIPAIEPAASSGGGAGGGIPGGGGGGDGGGGWGARPGGYGGGNGGEGGGEAGEGGGGGNA